MLCKGYTVEWRVVEVCLEVPRDSDKQRRLDDFNANPRLLLSIQSQKEALVVIPRSLSKREQTRARIEEMTVGTFS
jgi:hypothetical protein